MVNTIIYSSPLVGDIDTSSYVGLVILESCLRSRLALRRVAIANLAASFFSACNSACVSFIAVVITPMKRFRSRNAENRTKVQKYKVPKSGKASFLHGTV